MQCMAVSGSIYVTYMAVWLSAVTGVVGQYTRVPSWTADKIVEVLPSLIMALYHLLS
jgi:hypothetical protein